MIRMEIDSMPAELDEASRRIMLLEIERQALLKETDRDSIERLEVLEKEISGFRERADVMKAPLPSIQVQNCFCTSFLRAPHTGLEITWRVTWR